MEQHPSAISPLSYYYYLRHGNLGLPGLDNNKQLHRGDKHMLRWAAIFLVIAIIAALFGFGGIAGAAASIAKTLFFIFIAICVVLFLIGVFAGRGL